jgi:origin recognition complex subunit 2
MAPSAKRRRVSEPNGDSPTLNGSPTTISKSKSPSKTRATSFTTTTLSGDEDVIESEPGHQGERRSRHVIGEDGFAEESDGSSINALSEEDENPPPWNTSTTPFETETSGDAYLHAMSRPVKTSNNRLSERVEPFSLPSFCSAVREAFETTESAHKSSLTNHVHSYEKRFPQWLFELLEGFSLLFHGIGSKRDLLNKFASSVLQRQGDVIILNGFLASLTITDLMGAIETQVLGDDATVGKGSRAGDKLDERARRLVDRLADSTARRPLFLVVHNLDSPPLRTLRAQSILSLLASQPRVHLLATMDHINGTLLLPSSSASSRQRGFNFIYHHVSTFASYLPETTLSNIPATLFPPSIYPPANSDTKGARGKSTAQSTIFVLASVTPHAKRMFRVLMDHQLESTHHLTESQLRSVDSHISDADSTPSFAMLYGTLFVKGRDGFFASSTSMLDALLQEFRDHGIVLGSEKPPEGEGQLETDEAAEQGRREWLWIGMPRRHLLEVKESLDEET